MLNERAKRALIYTSQCIAEDAPIGSYNFYLVEMKYSSTKHLINR